MKHFLVILGLTALVWLGVSMSENDEYPMRVRVEMTGYDTVRYFVLRCARFGDDWQEYTGVDRSSGLHTDFLFDTDAQGSHHNVAVRRIVFRKDYTTTLQR